MTAVIAAVVVLRTAAAAAPFASAPFAAAGASDPPDATPAPAPDTTLMRFPTLHGGRIVFVAHGDLWEVARAGGVAQRLTSDPGSDWMPRFSPDGRWIAFTGNSQGSTDVYVMPASGGPARRLTYWSDVMTDAPLRWGPNNLVVTWTPDSRRIVFLSRRKAWNLWDSQLYEVGLDGGLPRALPLDRGGLMSFSPDGRRIVYNRIFTNFRNWKRYDGGLAQDVYLYDFTTQRLQRLTDWKGTDTAPMWYHDTVYFLSDRDAARRENIWALDLATHALRQVTHFTDYDIDFPSLGDDGIVFQQGGWLYVLDLPAETLHRLSVSVADDGGRTGARVVDASRYLRDPDNAQLTDYDLAPNGRRALLVARGDVFSVAVAPGETRDLTATSDADEDHPACSPDGRWVAYTTDVSGEQQIAVRAAQGGPQRLLTHFASGYFYRPAWSADSARIAFSDNEHRLWYLAVTGASVRAGAAAAGAGAGAGAPMLVAQDLYQEMHDYSWSPDGRWLAYSLTDAAQQRQIWLYELATRRATRVSEPGSDDFQPRFDASGRYLFFLSSRQENPVLAENEFDIADLKTTGLYVATLQADELSPFAPRAPEAAAGRAAADDRASAGVSVPLHIDLLGLMQRAVPVPIPQATLTGFDLRGSGIGTQIYYQTQPPSTIAAPLANEPSDLHLYDLGARADSVLIHDITSYVVSADGTALMYRHDGTGGPFFYIVPAGSAAAHAAAAARPLDLSHMRVRVDPRREWDEMFHSAWRLERDFFYRPQMNGVDWVGVRRAYERLLPLAGSRDDLNYLIGEMLGELGNSHTYVAGGDRGGGSGGGGTTPAPGAYLGVDYGVDARTDRYVFSRVYAGDNTRPEYRSPLTEPGIRVHAGDELVAIDGQRVPIGRPPESYLLGKQGHTVRLTVAGQGGTRDVLVTPLDDELSLRAKAWVDHNRSLVDAASGGRIGYVYLGDTDESGMEAFIRQFYGQLDRQALILDLRWNTGGVADPLVLERLRRVLVGMTTNREGAALTVPQRLLAGPKVCLINEYTVSDGELLAYYFRQYGLGPLIGTRSWGGVRFYRGDWALLDGGYITIPETASYDLQSRWIIENHGVDPDQVVQDSPAQLLSGTDAQLQAAVNDLLQTLSQHPAIVPPPPSALPAYANQPPR